MKVSIGQSYGGGIVFYVDESEQHGLIAATRDQNQRSGNCWLIKKYVTSDYETIGATKDGLYAGKINTKLIIDYEDARSSAAQICANYEGGGYRDWYLPSKYELNLLYKQKKVVGGFEDWGYWSSTECTSRSAWFQDFTSGYLTSGGQYTDDKLSAQNVRAVRAF
jgi:hypothetical protein